MTDPGRGEPLEFGSAQEVFALMRERGRRVTAPCRLVLEELFGAEGPVSVQFIVGRNPDSGFEASSIYRNLERLEELGVVRHVHLGHGPSLYLLVGAGQPEFLACERCDRVLMIDPVEFDPVRDQVRERFGYEARFTHFPIVGLCPACRADVEGDADP